MAQRWSNGPSGSVNARLGGANPKAMYRDPLTIEEVLNSRPICYPFNILNICLVTDAAGPWS